MDRAEIVSILRIIRTGHFGQAREAIEAAIALIEPQPVTEAGLREAGLESLEEFSGMTTYRLRTTPIQHSAKYIQCDVVRGKFQWGVRTYDQYISLPGITDMQALNAVIAALRGAP